MNGSFEQKYNFLFRTFDTSYQSIYHIKILSNMIYTVQESLFLLNFLKLKVSSQEIKNIVARGFISIELNPEKDYLTMFESQQLIINMISHSSGLCAILGITSIGSHNTGI